MAIRFSLAGLVLALCPAMGFAAEPCLQADLRAGAEAATMEAMNRAEREFLGPLPGAGSGSFGMLAQGTPVVLLAGPALAFGVCHGPWRAMAHLRPIAADMPDGIGIFTDPATLRGLSQGLSVEATGWRELGRLRAGLGLGLEADWTRLHLSSALIDLPSQDFALVVPVTLRLQMPLSHGAVELWLRESWTRGTWGTVAGLGYETRF